MKPQMISRVVKGGLLTTNKERKRFHYLQIAQKSNLNEEFKRSKRIINKMINKGFKMVPFECCCEPGDDLIQINKNGVVEKTGTAEGAWGERSLYAKLKKRGLSDTAVLRKGLELRGIEADEVNPGVFVPKDNQNFRGYVNSDVFMNESKEGD